MLPNSAPNISYPKMILLLENLKLDIRSRISIIKLRMTLRPRRAMYIYIYIYIYIFIYAFCFTAIKRLAGAGPRHIIAPNVSRMPNNRGLDFNYTWDKTLRMNSHCFGFVCSAGKEPWHAHCIIDAWVKLAKSYPSDYF